jgi:hypothetical protein
MPRRFIPGERAPGTKFIGGCMDAKASLEVMEKKEISCPYQESNLNSSVVQPIT